ncbi:histone-binding protein RBBP7 [Strigomonas culicis]|uniref:Histone-binding protein RBBP7 n=1 Tax=Strigomonas culicis TaxID=28005 RepID=S9WH50_9TRYP|nr:histone-binding protein RBBP7 [Strigomonas culicis]|eukprot:EPY35090.1 histone-binding protein RBBP7 [Strigomonas culicis]
MHTLEWPSLAVEWIPDRRFADPERDYTLNYVLVGTQAARGQPNVVRVMEVAVANPEAAGVMYDLYGDADMDHGDAEMEEMYKACVDPGKLFTNVQGHLACEQVVHVDAPVLRIRALPVETNIVAVKTASGFVGVYNLVQDLATDARGHTVPEALLRGHKAGGFGLAWNVAKLGHIASGGDDGLVNYWDIQHRISVDYVEGGAGPDLIGPEVQPLQRLTGHSDVVTDVTWHETHGHLLASASMDGDVRIWDTRFNTVCTTISGAHVGGTTSAQFHPVGAFQLATGGMDSAVHLWDIRRPHDPVVALAYHGRAVQAVQWSPFDERVLASSGDDGRVVVWDIGKASLPYAYSEEGLAPPEVSFVHLGHMGRVTAHAWSRCRQDPLLMASTDTVNGLQIYRPRESVVKDFIPSLMR